MCLGPIPPPGIQILSQIPEGGEGSRGQMPHICLGSPPRLGLNMDRCIMKWMIDESTLSKDLLVPLLIQIFPKDAPYRAGKGWGATH